MTKTTLLLATMTFAVLAACGVAVVALLAVPTNEARAATTTSDDATHYALVDKWGRYGSGNGQFMQAADVATGPNCNVYVADFQNNRIQKFTPGGDFLKTWGGLGAGNGQFRYPGGVAVDSRGYVYVADSRNHRIQKFTSNGTFVAKWGSDGVGDRQFSRPYTIGVDGRGNAYAGDADMNRIQSFTTVFLPFYKLARA